MKKIIILIVISLCLFGCGNKEQVNEEVKDDNKIINKLDSNKDYIYFNDFNILIVDNEEYNMQIPVINLNSDDANNTNLEIRNEYNNNYSNYKLDDNNLLVGIIMRNYSYINKEYISLVVSNTYYLNGKIGDEKINSYVFNINSGKLLSNNDILDIYDLDNDSLLEYIDKNINNTDKDYILMNIKTNGYKLFINNDNKLVIVYYEITDNEEIKKELIYD